MNKYNIQKEEISITKYIAQDGQKFESEKSAYLHNCYLLMGDILTNHTNCIDINEDIFKDNTITFCKFSNKEELDMFLYAYLDYYCVSNEKEIMKKAEERVDFPCTLCSIENGLFFKEDLLNEFKKIIYGMDNKWGDDYEMYV